MYTSALNVLSLDQDLSYGARVIGLTEALLGEAETRETLRQLFTQHGLLVFEEVEASAAMQIGISNVFGRMKEHPVKGVSRVNSKSMPGVIEIATNPSMCIVEIDGKPLMNWQPWHFDHSYNNELNRAGVLRAVQVASEGGMTGFADGIQIYRDMNPDLRRRLESLNALYSLDLRYSKQPFGLPPTFRLVKPHEDELLSVAYAMPRAIHPIVWRRDTGEEVLHMSPYGARGIEGMDDAAAYHLLSEAWDEVLRVMRPYHHAWRGDEMIIWDNWRLLHEATGCDPSVPRVMHRTTIAGDYGLGRLRTSRRSKAEIERLIRIERCRRCKRISVLGGICGPIS